MHDVRSKSPPWGYASRSNSRELPDPSPPFGLDIDRCINWEVLPKSAVPQSMNKLVLN